MFKQFFWKIVLCMLPVLLALAVIGDAFANNRFKLGVDLVGGTILVYEIDTRKQLAETGAKESFDPKRDTNLLAESLKRRIDPNDLYNIVIRPAGGEGRVEIILPTGGVERAAEAQEAWNKLLTKMQDEYKLPRLNVPRGQVQRLQDRIVQVVQEEIWNKNLFSNKETLKALVDRAIEQPALAKDKKDEGQGLALLQDMLASEIDRYKNKTIVHLWEAGWAGPLNVAPFAVACSPSVFAKDSSLSPGTLISGYDPKTKTLFQANDLRGLIEQVKARVDDVNKNKEIDGWFKQQAWREVIAKLLKDYPILNQRKESLERVPADAIEELVDRVSLKGDYMGQAFLYAMEPLIGDDALQGRTVATESELSKDSSAFLDPKDIRKTVDTLYGPSPRKVEKEIEEFYAQSGLKRDLTFEEVQRIKDLVSKVGSLEFRILANSVDDVAAIKEAQSMLNDAKEGSDTFADLKAAQLTGQPPPAPRVIGTKESKYFPIKLRGGESLVSYAWVELGPQERQQLGLNNNALREAGRSGNAWAFMNGKEDRAEQIPLAGGASDGGSKLMLQGALFFKRKCLDRNLTDDERRNKKWEYFILTRNPEIDPATGLPSSRIDGKYLVSAMNQPDNVGRPAVSFTFNAAGGRLFRDVTRKNIPSGEDTGTPIKRHLAIILDGQVMSAPTINSEISTHGQISGSFTNREVDQLVNILRAGALPATLKRKPVSENTMGATLGQDTVRMGLQAVVAAFAIVLAFMIVYYRFAGLVASVALLANLILTVGFMVAVKATFTLPGLAGLVLMLGMAVDANILIYERLREEREKGASVLLALRNGYDRAFGTIIDTHLSSIFTAVVLYVVGNDQLKGFGVSLTVGLLISLFTSLYMTRVIFDLWAAMGWLKKLSMFRFFAQPNIDFMAIRKPMITATAIITVLGAALFIGRLPNDLNIDFVGGTAYSGQLVKSQAKTTEELRALLDEANQKARLKDAKAAEVNENEHIFEVWYEDGQPKRKVTLANRPEGETKAARESNVAQRAAELPDWTVEQIFPSSQKAEGNKSHYFTVRTTEKEQDLVQTVLDRLLQYKDGNTWKELLKKVQMEYNERELLNGGKETRITFYETTADNKKGEQTQASPSFVTSLLARELTAKFNVADRNLLPFTFELTSEDAEDEGDGRFKVARLIITPKAQSLDARQVALVKQALDATKDAFFRSPQPESLQTFDSQLAAETRMRAMYAILLSWGAILLYLWFRFGSWTFGLAAVLCLIHDLFFTLGIIAACHYINNIFPGFMGIEDFKIDLPAVAALLTLVGYSVNDTIVVFDRIREVRGKNPDLTPQMINDSVNQTLSRTLLASLTTWLVVIVLYIAGGPGVHLFAFVMVVGVVVGTYSSIYVASPLLLLFREGVKGNIKMPATPDEPDADLKGGMEPA